MSNTEQVQVVESSFLDKLDNLMDTFSAGDVVVHIRHFADFESAFEPLKEGSVIEKGFRKYTITESESIDLSFRRMYNNKLFTLPDAKIFVEKLHSLSEEIYTKQKELHTILHTLTL